jgi:hypothetical protein
MSIEDVARYCNVVDPRTKRIAQELAKSDYEVAVMYLEKHSLRKKTEENKDGQ